MFSCFDRFSVAYCQQCVHGPEGCLVPSRQGEVLDLTHHTEELDAKLRSIAKKKSMEIDIEIESDKKTNPIPIKILILGGPSSGKSTIFKQMKIIHVDGFKQPEELIQYKHLIDSNIRDSYLQLIAGARILGVPLDAIEHVTYEINEIYEPMSAEFEARTTPELVEPLREFWQSEQVQEVYKRRYEFELMDSTKYYIDNLDRISDPEYLPNEEDIVHSRKPTTTVHSIVFDYTGANLRMTDVGGQRSERKKWLHLFDDAQVVLFVIDLTGYAKRSDESRAEMSRFPRLFEGINTDAYDMKVALKIFNDVAQNKSLQMAVFLLFFNKVDAFQELLPHVNLKHCFSKYEGPNEYDETSKYISDKFHSAAVNRKSVYSHFTTATNTENVKLVFRACMESVFKANSKATGLA